jgi:lipopolysaccharide/colanic/teichoic acid biosynthesis glycosyltransferase
MKRLCDLVISFMMLGLLAPILILISITILIADGRPVFFMQYRVGKNRELFRIFKYRTMTVREGSEHGSFDAGNHSRVTPIGMVLRKTKLDELPQLINVLIGQMSVVGPRPEVEKWTMVYADRWDKVLKVKPGITDNASILFRKEEELLARSENPEETYRNIVLPQKLDYYEQYVERHTVFGDLLILLKTMYIILFK